SGIFPFYDLLKTIPPDIVDGGVEAYSAVKNPEIPVDKLLHFAMGVFWKAGMHHWITGQTENLIDLGPYAEPIRKFLREETGFPAECALTIGVLPPSTRLIALHNPYQDSTKAWSNFRFYVSGIEFVLATGPRVDAEFKTSTFSGHPLRPILVFDFSGEI